MIKIRCIEKFRNSNSICAYKIEDEEGTSIVVKPEQLKKAIKNKEVTVTNLKLTSDDRLIYTPETSEILRIKEKETYGKLIKKAKVLGKCKEVAVPYDKYCYLIHKSNGKYILYIPDDVVSLNAELEGITDKNWTISMRASEYWNMISSLNGEELKVVGGHGLKSIEEAFMRLDVDLLDLSLLDTSNVVTMRAAFLECKAKSINFSNFDTRKVKNMESMFKFCHTEYLNLSSFNIRRAENLIYMFYCCYTKTLDISAFKLSVNAVIYDMFEHYSGQIKASDKNIIYEYEHRRS